MKHIITHIPLTSWLCFIGAALTLIVLPFHTRPLVIALSFLAAACYITAMVLAIREWRAAQKQWKQTSKRLDELMRGLRQ